MKRDIYYIDWVHGFDQKFLKDNSSWVLPQLSALLGKLPLAKNEKELYSASLSIKRISSEVESITFSNGMPVTKEILNSMIKFAVQTNRSDILSGTQLATPRYSAAVPFILSALKEQRNLSYSRWDFSDPHIRFFLESEWVNALQCTEVPTFSIEDVLDFRAKARTFRTGARAGTLRSLNTTTSITRTGNETFDDLPKYWKLALCQTWVFHPSNRHPLAITNPYSIDTVMEPLVSGEVLQPVKAKLNSVKNEEVDWDNMWSIVAAS